MSVRQDGPPHSDEKCADSGEKCAAPSCWSDGRRRRVDGREAVLCRAHAKLFFGVSS